MGQLRKENQTPGYALCTICSSCNEIRDFIERVKIQQKSGNVTFKYVCQWDLHGIYTVHTKETERRIENIQFTCIS